MMALTREATLEAVAQLGVFQNPRPVSSRSFVGLAGERTIAGRAVTLVVLLDDAFPLHLPTILLEPWDALGYLPHVMPPLGLICFLDPEGIVLDRARPVDIIQDAIARACQTLEAGATGQNHADFNDEFEAYWGLLDHQGPQVRALLECGPDVRQPWVTRLADADGGDTTYLGTAADFVSYFQGYPPQGALKIQPGLVVPLEADQVVVPPRPGQSSWNALELRQVITHGLSAANTERLQAVLRRPTLACEYVFLQLHRPSGGESLVGMRFDRVGALHPLHPDAEITASVPLTVMRLDRQYLVARGGGTTALAKKRVLVVGTGAVGGHLVFELARAGVLDLVLIDPDVLTPDNSFRHVLGRRYWQCAKVRALQYEIEAQLPYVQVSPITASIEQVLTWRGFDFAPFDLVVIATGNPTVDLMLNARLHALELGPSAVFAWLEPLGIGGHALLAGPRLPGGCLQCLYSSPVPGEQALHNRVAFAAPGQAFGRALSGCGSLHTPFGGLDALRTAELAARLAIETLTGQHARSCVRSWKGDASAFIAQGFHLADRFAFDIAALERQQHAFQSATCSVCGAPA